MSKARIYEFDPVIYPRKLWVATGDINEVLSKFEYVDGKPLEAKSKGFFGVTFDIATDKERTKLGCLIYFRHIETSAQAMHEAVHAANRIFEDLGITFTLYADEHYAYFVAWICDCIDKVRTGKIKDK